MNSKDLRALVRRQLREVLSILNEEQGPFFTQDPDDGYARPKLNRIDHARVSGYINYTLGGDEKKRDARIKPGRKLTLSTFLGIIKQIHIKKGETINLTTSVLEKWFNGHDIELDRVPLLFDFKTKEIEVVELDKGIARQKAEKAKNAAEKEVEKETGIETKPEPETAPVGVAEGAPLKGILGEFKMGALDITVQDIINMFVRRFKDDIEIRKDFRAGKISKEDFANQLKTEFGIKEEISHEIYDDLLNISKSL